jgi:hypothetical protein
LLNDCFGNDLATLAAGTGTALTDGRGKHGRGKAWPAPFTSLGAYGAHDETVADLATDLHRSLYRRAVGD